MFKSETTVVKASFIELQQHFTAQDNHISRPIGLNPYVLPALSCIMPMHILHFDVQVYLTSNLLKISHRRNTTLKYHRKFTHTGNDLTPINLKFDILSMT
jgi:hypothetical protein